jgi:hypothetical protein
MPRGKAAGERCVHLDASMRCELFEDPRRPRFCATFAAEPAVCGANREQALAILAELEILTLPPAAAGGLQL